MWDICMGSGCCQANFTQRIPWGNSLLLDPVHSNHSLTPTSIPSLTCHYSRWNSQCMLTSTTISFIYNGSFKSQALLPLARPRLNMLRVIHPCILTVTPAHPTKRGIIDPSYKYKLVGKKLEKQSQAVVMFHGP